MPRTARQALITLIVALHTVVATCGPGLHSVPGLGHVGRLAGDARGDDRAAVVGVAASSGEHCPLCDHFAQGQVPTPPVPGFTSPLGRRADQPPTAWAIPHRLAATVRPRAPPLGDLRKIAPPAPESRLAPA